MYFPLPCLITRGYVKGSPQEFTWWPRCQVKSSYPKACPNLTLSWRIGEESITRTTVFLGSCFMLDQEHLGIPEDTINLWIKANHINMEFRVWKLQPFPSCVSSLLRLLSWSSVYSQSAHYQPEFGKDNWGCQNWYTGCHKWGCLRKFKRKAWLNMG